MINLTQKLKCTSTPLLTCFISINYLGISKMQIIDLCNLSTIPTIFAAFFIYLLYEQLVDVIVANIFIYTPHIHKYDTRRHHHHHRIELKKCIQKNENKKTFLHIVLNSWHATA